MTSLIKRAVLVLILAGTAAAPALAFDGPTDFAPGGDGPDDPGFDGPGDFSPNPPSGPGPVAAAGGGDNRPAGPGVNSCPGGQLVVSYEVDDDNHPIGSTFTRTCVPYR